MANYTQTFDKISRKVVKDGKCEVCGKYVRRSATLYQTLNPLNKNKQGYPKTPGQIKAELAIEARDWAPDFTHEKCKSDA